MKGHRLVYGIAVDDQVGWEIAASSIELTRYEQDHLVGKTNVGRIPEANFTGCVGYFGQFMAVGAQWAVFANFYRSLQPERTGTRFIQRDIHLIAFNDFTACDADVAFFLSQMSEPIVIRRSGTPLDGWDISRRPVLSAERLRPFEDLDDDFATDLMTVVLDDAQTLLLDSEGRARQLLPAVVLALPPVLRPYATFTTLASDGVSADVRMRAMRSFPSDPPANIIDLERKRVTTSRKGVAADLAKTIVGALRKGINGLASYHGYVGAASPGNAQYAVVVDAMLEADRRWRGNERLRVSLGGPEKWAAASDFLRMTTQSAADRLSTIAAITENLNMPEEAPGFISFLSTLQPNAAERRTVIEGTVRRVANESEEAVVAAADALDRAIYSAGDEFVNQFVSTVDARTALEIILELRRRGYGLRSAAAGQVLRRWSFAGEPGWPQTRELIELALTRDGVGALLENDTLLTQLAADPRGAIAISLVQSRAGAISEFAKLARQHPAATAEVLAERPAESFELREDDLPLPAIVELAARPDIAHAGVVLRLFADAYASASQQQIDAIDPNRLKEARARANAQPETRRRIITADLRRPIAEAELSFRDNLLRLARDWEKGTITSETLLDVLRSDGDDAYSHDIAWYFVAAVHDDESFDLLRLVKSWSESGIRALRLLQMTIAVVLLAGDSRRDAAAILGVCAGAVSRLRPRADRPRYLEQWRPASIDEVELLRHACGFAIGMAAAEDVRKAGVQALPDKEQSHTIAQRMYSVADALEQLNSRDLDRLSSFLERGLVDGNEIEIANAGDKLLKWFGSAFTKTDLQKKLTRIRDNADSQSRSEKKKP